jgi:hypothetical protein
VPTLATVAKGFSGVFCELQTGARLGAAELFAQLEQEQRVQRVRLLREGPGVYLVQAQDSCTPLYQFLSRRRQPRPG